MATQTTNLGLTKPAYDEAADIVPAVNNNMDTLDSKIGAVPANSSIQGQLDSHSQAIETLSDKIGNIISFENFPVTADQYGISSIGLTTNRSNRVISAMTVTDWIGVTLIVPASNNNYVNVLMWDRTTGKPVSSGTSATIRLSIFAG